jgi:RNA polymerase sigma factor (TIGR02999 family)
MSAEPEGEVSRLLNSLETGEPSARARVFALLYDELRALAQNVMGDRRAGQTLQPTALVHEAFLKLADHPTPEAGKDRGHFLAIAAKAMRGVLVDHARARRAQKRGGAGERVPLEGLEEFFAGRESDLLELDEALQKLARADASLAAIVELRFFGGLSVEETARVLGVSVPTVVRDWRLARIWLQRALEP